MKSVLLSVRPQWVEKILNGEKTIEIRKKFPKGYVGWVYIYCTKGGQTLFPSVADDDHEKTHYELLDKEEKFAFVFDELNGKVVARFWVDKVGWFSKETFGTYEEPFTYNQDDLLKKSCLTEKELDIYLQGKNGKAIHITKLEIFDKPKELNEFRPYCDKCFSINNKCLNCKAYMVDIDLGDWCNKNKLALTKAPQSWQFIEV